MPSPTRPACSVKTVEALYRTKAELLKAAVDYAIAGDVEPIPVLAREPVAAMEAAPDAAAMLGLHARHVRAVNGRAAQLFWVVDAGRGGRGHRLLRAGCRTDARSGAVMDTEARLTRTSGWPAGLRP